MGKRITKRARLIAVAAVLSVRITLAAGSDAVVVDCDGEGSHWTTLFTNAVPLMWEWPTKATHAALVAESMNDTFSTNFTEIATNVLWQAFASDAPDKEDVYALSLTFYGGEGVVGVLTSQLAVVSGAFRAANVNAFVDNAVWSKVRNNAVVPYRPIFAEAATNAAVAQLVIAKSGGATQTNVFPFATGYYGWKLRNNGWGYGAFALSLTFPKTEADALTSELFRPLDGTAVSVR